MPINEITFAPGYITLTRESGNKTRYAIADVLRALDIPAGLTHSQVTGIAILADLNVILIRTLINRGYLDQSFLEDGGFDLESLTEAIEGIGGDYEKPDISVPE